MEEWASVLFMLATKLVSGMFQHVPTVLNRLINPVQKILNFEFACRGKSYIQMFGLVFRTPLFCDLLWQEWPMMKNSGRLCLIWHRKCLISVCVCMCVSVCNVYSNTENCVEMQWWNSKQVLQKLFIESHAARSFLFVQCIALWSAFATKVWSVVDHGETIRVKRLHVAMCPVPASHSTSFKRISLETGRPGSRGHCKTTLD